jgi:hypothetical protein
MTGEVPAHSLSKKKGDILAETQEMILGRSLVRPGAVGGRVIAGVHVQGISNTLCERLRSARLVCLVCAVVQWCEYGYVEG